MKTRPVCGECRKANVTSAVLVGNPRRTAMKSIARLAKDVGVAA